MAETLNLDEDPGGETLEGQTTFQDALKRVKRGPGRPRKEKEQEAPAPAPTSLTGSQPRGEGRLEKRIGEVIERLAEQRESREDGELAEELRRSKGAIAGISSSPCFRASSNFAARLSARSLTIPPQANRLGVTR